MDCFNKKLAQDILDDLTDEYLELGSDIEKFINDSSKNDYDTMKALQGKYGFDLMDEDFTGDSDVYYTNDKQDTIFVPELSFYGQFTFSNGAWFEEYTGGNDNEDYSGYTFAEAAYEVVVGMLLLKFLDKIPPQYLKAKQ